MWTTHPAENARAIKKLKDNNPLEAIKYRQNFLKKVDKIWH